MKEWRGNKRSLLSNTRQAAKVFANLPVEKFLIAVDENDEEYMIEEIVQRKLHMDDDKEWCYALKIRKAEGCCIRR